MKKLCFSKIVLALTLVTLLFSPKEAKAFLLLGDGALGDYTGSFTYAAANASSAQIVVSLTNTSPVANGGFITALAFNNPLDLITGVSLASTDPDFGLLGASTFQNGISGSPYGNFDIGASITSSWLGGGAPQPGIGVGNSATFTFNLTGSSLNTLTADTFAQTLSSGNAGGGNKAFVVRFRGFEDDGSDKVPGTFIPPNPPPPVVPEPATMMLFGTGLVGAFLRKKVA